MKNIKLITGILTMLLLSLTLVTATVNDANSSYSFNDNSFSLNDDGSNGYTLINNNALRILVSGDNYAYSFNSTTDNLLTSPLLNVKTISSWVKFNNFPSSSDPIVVEQRTTDGYYFAIDGSARSVPGALHILDDDGASSHCRSQSLTWNNDQWYHIVFIKGEGSNNGTFYRDNVQLNNSGCALRSDNHLNNDGNNLSIGNYDDLLINFDGYIDQPVFYDRALTMSEVTTLYNDGIIFDPLESLPETCSTTNTTFYNEDFLDITFNNTCITSSIYFDVFTECEIVFVNGTQTTLSNCTFNNDFYFYNLASATLNNSNTHIDITEACELSGAVCDVNKYYQISSYNIYDNVSINSFNVTITNLNYVNQSYYNYSLYDTIPLTIETWYYYSNNNTGLAEVTKRGFTTTTYNITLPTNCTENDFYIQKRTNAFGENTLYCNEEVIDTTDEVTGLSFHDLYLNTYYEENFSTTNGIITTNLLNTTVETINITFNAETFFSKTVTNENVYNDLNESLYHSIISFNTTELITNDDLDNVTYYYYENKTLEHNVTADSDLTGFGTLIGMRLYLVDDDEETYITGFKVFNGTKSTNATKGYVLDDSNVIIATGDITDSIVYFNDSVLVGDGYYLMVDDDGNNYRTARNTGGDLPIMMGNINLTRSYSINIGSNVTSDWGNNVYNVEEIYAFVPESITNPTYFNSGDYYIMASKDGYYNSYLNITVSDLDVTTYNYSLYDTILNLIVKHTVGEDNITEFNSSIYEPINDYTINTTTTTGIVNVPLIKGFNYTSTVASNNYTTDVDNISSWSTSDYNYTQYLFAYNSLYINFADIITKLTVENVTMDLISDAFSDNYSTSNGTIYVTNLAPETYIARYTSDDYQESFYEFTIVDDSTQNITLYLIEANESSTIVVNVLNEKARNQEGATVKALRFDITTNAYHLQEMCVTDYNGECYMSLTKDDEYYKFIIDYDGQTLLTSDPFIIRKDNLVFSIITTGIIGDYINDYNDITSSIVYNNETGNWRLDYDDTNALTNSVTLEVYELKGDGETLINTSTITGASGTILLGMSAESGKIYVANAYADGEFLDSGEYETPAYDLFSELGLFLQIMLTLVMVGFSLYMIEALPITLFVSLLIGRLINLNILPYGTIFTGITLGIIILWWLKKR
jgi:hypothetical protein